MHRSARNQDENQDPPILGRVLIDVIFGSGSRGCSLLLFLVQDKGDQQVLGVDPLAGGGVDLVDGAVDVGDGCMEDYTGRGRKRLSEDAWGKRGPFPKLPAGGRPFAGKGGFDRKSVCRRLGGEGGFAGELFRKKRRGTHCVGTVPFAAKTAQKSPK